MKGRIIKSTGSWYEILEDRYQDRYKARLRGIFKLSNLRVTNPVAVGDQVVFEKVQSTGGEFEITEILPRQNYFIRKSTHKTAHDHLVATNLDQVAIIFTLKMPRTSVGFLDRALVTSEAYRIPAVIIFNKIDLYSPAQLEEIHYYIQLYEKIGYKCIKASSVNQTGIDEVFHIMSGKITLIMGHSGAGKSTLMNTLFPELDLKTSEISRFADKGVHTTTFAEMHILDNNTFLIDTPGIKELGISEIEEHELSHYFPEMRALLGKCRFHDCRHLNEPDCFVYKEVTEQHIAPTRYQSYLSMLLGEDNRK